MTIRTTEVVYCVVARGASVIAVQDNTAVIQSLAISGNWTVASAITNDGAGANVTGSVHFLPTDTTNTGHLFLDTSNPTLNAAILAGDTLAVTVAINGVPQNAGSDIIHVYLRPIRTIDFLALRNGSHVPVTLAAAPNYAAYDWTLTPLTLLGTAAFAPVPSGSNLTVAFSAANPPPSWNIDGATFSIQINASNSVSPFRNSVSQFGLFPGPNPSLPTIAVRALEKAPGVPLAGYTYLRSRVINAGTGNGINAAPPAPATIVGAVTGAPADWPTALAFDTTGRLQNVNENTVSTWSGGNGNLTVTVHDGNNVRPDAFVSGLAFKMRQLTADAPYRLALPFDVANGTRNITVNLDAAFAFATLNPTGGTSAFTSSVAPVPQLQWTQFALRAGDAATLNVTLAATAAGFPADSCTIPIAVSTPAMATISVVPATLPTARQEIRYQASLTASVTPAAGQQLEWYLEATESTDLEFGTPISTTAATNVLRTKALHVIPQAWAAGNRTVHVHCVLRGGGGVVLATTDAPLPANVTLPIAATLPNINSTLMIDRSGSMAAEFRWLGAMSGALNFAQLVKDRNVSAGKSHGVQAMWFGGWDDQPTSNYPSPAVPTDPLGAGNYGTLLGDGGAGVIPLDFSHFATAASFNAAFTEAATRQQPFFWTAIGTGILAAKDALLAADPGHTKERVVFLFTDGMENRVPFVNEATLAGGAYWFHPDPALGLPNNVDPQTRIYACALGTAQSFADALKPACNNTGGIGELDVKFIPSPQPDAAAISTLVQNWFNSSFAFMFGYATLTAPDPELSSGATATHTVVVNEGHSQLVMSVFAAAPPVTDWTVDVQPPGGTTVITEAAVLAGAFGSSVRLYTGPLHKTFVIDLPLAIPGESQRWAGTWRAHVTRSGATTGDYLFSAMAKQDITYQVGLDAPAPTRIGNRVTVRAYLAQGNALISDAKVVAHVSSPGGWLDDPIARKAGRTHFVVAPHKGQPASDLDNVQAATRAILSELHIKRNTFDVPLLPTTPGFYEGSFIVDEPGTWEVLTSADGHRGGAHDGAKWEKTYGELRELLPPRIYEKERAWLAKEDPDGQRYHLEDDQTFGVLFQPDVKASPTGGVLRKDEIDLFVVPQDANGLLLGAGRARDIVFYTDCGLTFPSQDGGQGTYVARIPLHGNHIRFVRGVVLGEKLTLGDPRHPIPICNGRLDLAQFRVRVLGVDIPLQVRSPLGKVTREDVELAFPTYGHTLTAASTTLTHLIKDDLAKHLSAAKGAATFVATLRRAMDVDFARTDAAVAARRYGIVVAKQAACAFCRENGHDSVIGKLAGQLEAMFGALLEEWTPEHIESAAQCRDGFFAEADDAREVVRQLLGALPEQSHKKS